MSDEKSLHTRILETAIITGVSVMVASIIGSAFAFVWSKAINFDDSLKRATEKIEATQIVYGEAIEKNAKELEELKKILTPTVKTNSALKMSESEAPVPKERVPVQEALRSYSK